MTTDTLSAFPNGRVTIGAVEAVADQHRLAPLTLYLPPPFARRLRNEKFLPQLEAWAIEARVRVGFIEGGSQLRFWSRRELFDFRLRWLETAKTRSTLIAEHLGQPSRTVR